MGSLINFIVLVFAFACMKSFILRKEKDRYPCHLLIFYYVSQWCWYFADYKSHFTKYFVIKYIIGSLNNKFINIINLGHNSEISYLLL